MQNKELWDKAIQFLKDCKGKKTHIIHDYDMDGITGGLQLLHTLHRLDCEATASTQPGRKAALSTHELKRIKETHNPDRIIITDQDPISYNIYDHYRKIFPDTPTLIIDHHFVVEYEDAIFIHPKLIYDVDGANYCSSKFINDICEELTDIEDLSWLAVCGTMGDCNTKQFADFIKEVAEYENVEYDDIYESKFGIVGDAIDSASAVDPDAFLDYVNKLKNCITFQDAVNLGNPNSEVLDEVKQFQEKGLDLATIDGPIVWLEIESQFNIASWVCTLISFDNPSEVFVGYRKQVDGYSVNLRHQGGRVHLGNIMKPLAESLGGQGGGHAPASGGFIPTDKWDEFKEKITVAIKESLSKSS